MQGMFLKVWDEQQIPQAALDVGKAKPRVPSRGWEQEFLYFGSVSTSRKSGKRGNTGGRNGFFQAAVPGEHKSGTGKTPQYLRREQTQIFTLFPCSVLQINLL